jgi:hypothetical protein
MTNELTDLYLDVLDFIEPLRTRLNEPDALEYLFHRYGWDATMDDAAFARFQETATIIAPLEQFVQTAEASRAKLDSGSDLDASDIEEIAGAAAVLIKALAEFGMPNLSGLADPLGRPEFWASVAEQVFDDLLEQYLRVYQPIVFLVLRAWNVIRYDPTDVTGPARVPYTRVWFDWDQAATMLTDPLQALKEGYHWGDATQPFDYEGALDAIQLAFTSLRVPAAPFSPALVSAPIPGDASRSASEDVLAVRATLLERDFPDENAFYRLGVEVYPALRSADTAPTGLMVKPILEGGAGATLPLSSLLSFTLATVVSADDAVGLALFPGDVGLVAGAPAVGASLSLQTTGKGPRYAVGNAQTSHIELSGFLLRASVEGSVDDPEFKLEASFPGAGGQAGVKGVVNLSGADDFVQGTVKSDGLTFSFTPDVVWSSKAGLMFSGKPTISLDFPLSASVGPVTLTDLSVALSPTPKTTSASGIELRLGLDVRAALGPITLGISQIGFAFVITPYSRADVQALPAGAPAPTLGALDVGLQFAPPTGVGISVDAAGLISGGGFLEHTGDEYAGAFDVSISGYIVKAYGLIQTTLPTGLPGYSFVAVLSVQFVPGIELPFDFTLDGVGGFIGVNRTISVDAIEAALWAHHLDGLLFPADPVAAAPQLISALGSYFPAAQGRYVFGPLAKIGWAADIVSGEAALLLELPEPIKLLLIGDVQVGVPSDSPQLVLHISFDGGVEMGKQLAFFDATLHDSRLESYPIGGDLAFRYSWGDQAVFALALGGFNPQFQPPAGFPTLKRLAISIHSSVARIEAQSYLALTSNTLQFGARVELTAGTGSFNVHGWLGFDALCERNPLSFEFALTAGVDLRAGTDVIASVHLDGKLSGPTPWHIAGSASLSLLFFDVTVHFDKTWGSTAAALSAPNPVPALAAALADRSSWAGALPAAARAAITPVGAPGDAGEAALLDPACTLRITQRIVPLDQPITRFAGTPLGQTMTLTLDSITAFGNATTPAGTTSEEFAPAQFLDLTDAEKLSLPSFSTFDAGVELAGDAIDLGQSSRTRAVITPISYITTTLDSRPGPPNRTYLPTVTAVLALNASASSPSPGLGHYKPVAGTPALVTMAADQWTIASTSDLTIRTDIPCGGSKLDAHLALSQYLAAHPEETDGLQVVLTHEAA